MPEQPATDYDAVIVGGGHNGLTAAAYLAKAGCRVLVLERDDHVGGAAVSAQAFEGVDARLSRYAYLGESLCHTPAQTLTLFGLHVPDRLVDRIGNDELRDRIRAAVLASLNSVLAEPIEDVLAVDAAGDPCIEVKTTRDLEEALAMPGGNIFHGPLSWPWAEDDAELRTPAQRWGVATRFPDVLLCGSGAVRGGAVSGIGGHNAAMAVLEADAAG